MQSSSVQARPSTPAGPSLGSLASPGVSRSLRAEHSALPPVHRQSILVLYFGENVFKEIIVFFSVNYLTFKTVSFLKQVLQRK